ncbi:NFX1-type zinc finger-containing protein 1-like protein [Dinothrombium tinctorium]|uniref:NFX1-type zinc finger-containing protein 1-like protein n=1 Tax=Dinothrombium tinctorium TaxID=1965070 RepID=A0A3S3P5X5_9ACAR|nr:NFX1-type zinc finger-containing protein 1-like protein [Dinothrombium tinctorium]
MGVISQPVNQSNNVWPQTFTPSDHRAREQIEDETCIEFTPIVPTPQELLCPNGPSLRANKIKGPYTTLNEYATTHFRLLREDLVAPLRELVASVRREKERFDFSQSEDVYIGKQEVMKLVPGSLLCISNDYFDRSFVIARVSNLILCDDNHVEVSVAIFNEKEMSLIRKSNKRRIVAIESPTYFESVCHTLKQLQNIDRCTAYPMNSYIIFLEHNEFPPPYLKEQTCYDFTSLYKSEHDAGTTSNQNDFSKMKVLDMSPADKEALRTKLNLDESQFDAYYMGLSRQLAIIQGPPGTGKTLIGLLIVRTLVANNRAYGEKKPVIVLCYKNRVLDQFLEGVLNFTDKIVRFGGQCKSEMLERYVYQNGSSKRARQARVIGITITGAAKYYKTIKRLSPRIMIVEEAAEVLECHMYAALCEMIDHLILIGDHKQLRPIVTTNELSYKYKFDVSLFERLILNNFDYTTLSVQHRMSPFIAQLTRVAEIYTKFEDAENVKQHPLIEHLQQSLYFLNHNRFESEEVELKSKSNEFEAHFVVQLARYLVLKRIDESTITILTFYRAQKERIIQLMDKWPICKYEIGEGNKLTRFMVPLNVKVCTIDEFQGEESEIIIISFVRSNSEKRIGFLSNANRVCVALTRAKHALYAVGNFEMIAKCNDLWYKIIKHLKHGNYLGDWLPLKCSKSGFVKCIRSERQFANFNNSLKLETINCSN